MPLPMQPETDLDLAETVRAEMAQSEKDGRKALTASLIAFVIPSALFALNFLLNQFEPVYTYLNLLLAFTLYVPAFIAILSPLIFSIAGIVYGLASRKTRSGQWGMALGLLGMVLEFAWFTEAHH